MALQKIEKFPSVARLAPEHIEKNEMESALRDAAFARDALMRDLENEFAQRASKIRDDFLDRAAAIVAGD